MKKQFIKSVMSVLRLEDNIYTVAAIELIIDKLKESDYHYFVAYLGERKGEYEKPIQVLTNAVNEYYELKLLPYKEIAEKKAATIGKIFDDVKKMLHNKAIDYSKTKECKQIAKKYALENYGKQSRENIENARLSKIQEELYRKSKEYKEEFFNMTKEEFEKHKICETVYIRDNSKIFTDEIIDIIFTIGLENFKEYSRKSELMDFLHNNKLKPSIEKQIVKKEVEKIEGDSLLIDNQVKKLLTSKNTETFVY